MTPFRQEIDRLARDYPAFVIAPTRVYNGERVAAYRQDRAAQDGLYALIGTPQEVEAELAKAVAELRAGFAKITETMDTYGHLFPDSEDLGRGAIDATLTQALTELERNQEAQ